MSDKDLLVVISEMLRKQDRQAETLDRHTVILEKTNETLKQFIDISTQQYQQQYLQYQEQQEFNKGQRAYNKEQQEFNKGQRAYNKEQQQFNKEQQRFNEHFLSGINQLNEKTSNNQDQQNHFNERLLDKLTDIEKALKK